MVTIAETLPYVKKAEKLLTSAERIELISYLSINPKAGVIVEGLEGIRKIRWSRGSSVKSGGVRIIYYYHNESIPLYLLALFPKSEKANISSEEKIVLAKLTKQLIAFWRS